MKKYTSVFLVFILAFISLVLSFNTAFAMPGQSDVSVPGCMTGDMFSRTTGQPCGTSVVPECKVGDLFSSVTGKPCGAGNTMWCHTFNTNLGIGNSGDEVAALHKILGMEGISGPNPIHPDSQNFRNTFEEDTASMVTQFQEKYKSEILTPIGLRAGTGYLGARTRAKLNSLYGCSKPSGSSVTISGVSGPQTLDVNQQGTWVVKASSKNGGNLSYSVSWGDEIYASSIANSAKFAITQQSATFTHSYSRKGTYTPTFSVTNSGGQSAYVSLSVNVGETVTNTGYLFISPSNISLNVGESTNVKAYYQPPMPICPPGLACIQAFPAPVLVDATWSVGNKNIARLNYYYPPCQYNSSTGVATNCNVQVSVNGVSAGTTELKATYTTGGQTLYTSAKVVVNGTVSPLTVLSPNGGETWTKGTTQTIRWQDDTPFPTCPPVAGTSCVLGFPVLKYDIKLISYYPPCTSNVCPMYYPIQDARTIATAVPGSLYPWTIQNCTAANPCSSNFEILSGSYLIQVCQTGTSICDSSDSYFKIVSGEKNNLTITTVSLLPNARVGVDYDSTGPSIFKTNISLAGQNYNWSVISGALPVGLRLVTDAVTNGYAWLTGTPTNVGTYNFTVQVTSGYLSASKQFTLTVDPATNNQVPTISYLSPILGVVGTQVTIVGTNFTPTVNVVNFENSYLGGLTSVDGTTIKFTVPSQLQYPPCSMPMCEHAAPYEYVNGTYSVSVTNSNGISNTANFTITGNKESVLGAESFHFTLWLAKGSSGNEVMELQKFLSKAGYDTGIVDGSFGLKTEASVIKFQLANGLVGDGVVGVLTRAILNK